jgi:hypothetical protein
LKDPLAIGLGSLATGVGIGGACLTIAQIVFELLQHGLAPAALREAAPYFLLAGPITAGAVGAGFGWQRSLALENIWQRGVIGVLAAVGSILVGFLAAPVDRFLGLVGMLVWLAASLWFGIAGSRWAVRGSGNGMRETGNV